MRRVVAGVDFSEGSLVALRWAAGAARINGVPLLLVSTWEHPWWTFMPAPLSMSPVPPADDMRSVLQDQIGALIESEGLADVATEAPVVREGGAASIFVELAGPDDLLVVGSRGHGAARDTLLGSVSTRCTSTANCPVAVVPTDGAANRTDGPVVVGVDGSVNSAAAVKWAAENTDPGAEIAVVAVWGVPIIVGQDGTGADLSRVLDSDKDRATLAAEQASEVLTAANREHKLLVEQGEARRVLDHHGHSASMMVLGHRGRSGIAHAFLGSVATSLVHHPECVIVVVRAD
ncbi:MAG: universal stress protein [Actinomycetota bacterium]|nr:universal stress protein [Actinomycetota bacterium]